MVTDSAPIVVLKESARYSLENDAGRARVNETTERERRVGGAVRTRAGCPQGGISRKELESKLARVKREIESLHQAMLAGQLVFNLDGGHDTG